MLCAVAAVSLAPKTRTAIAATPQGTPLTSVADFTDTGNGYTLSSGNYYLNGNIKISYVITIQAGTTVTLDLNGYMLYRTYPNTGYVSYTIFNVEGDFTLNDTYAGTGRMHEVDNLYTEERGDTRTITGGVLGHGRVHVNGNFTMNGGTISGSYESGVYIAEGGNFTMNGGAIIGNHGKASGGSGGGLGETSGVGGNAPNIGAGVHNKKGTFTMTGGTITENCGYAGVYSVQYATFNVSGSPKIYNNKDGNCDINHTFNVAGKLTQGAEIHVQRTYYNKGIIATGYTQEEPFSDYFVADITYNGKCFYNDNGTLKLASHSLDDKGDCKYCGVWQAVWVAGDTYDTFEEGIEALNNAKNTVGVKMFTDGVLTSPLDTYSSELSNSRNITIDLNGYMISTAQGFDGSVALVSSGSLTIKDTYAGTDRKHTINGKEIIGGVITGGNGTLVDGNRRGGCVYVYGSGDFTMTGGTICGNTATYGGGVYMDKNCYLKGGTICGNTATYGGGVYVAANNLFVNINASNAVSTITDNTAAYGGGVYVNGGLRLYNTVNITNNKDGAGENAKESNVYLAPEKQILVNTLKDSSKIGISLADGYSGTFTSAYNPKDSDGNYIPPDTYFVSDDATKPCVHLNADNKAVLDVHTGGSATCKALAVCDSCGKGYGEYAGHTLSSVAQKDKTCTTDGALAHDHCSVCNKDFINGVEKTADELKIAAGHTLTEVELVDKTCTTDGALAHDHCSVCNKNFISGVEKTAEELKIPASHTLSSVAQINKTCTTDGVLAHDHCSVCNKDFISGVEKTAEELKIAAGHTLTEVVLLDKTCTTDGELAHDHCSVCNKDFINGEEKTAEELRIPAGHTVWQYVAKSATCTEVGWDAYEACMLCDYTTKVEKAALGHDEVSHEAKAATCTEGGWNAYVTCSRCDHSTYEEIAALGHDYEEEFTVDTEATCTTPGSKSKHCTRCEEKSEVTEIEALGHDEIAHEGKAATCTEGGWNAYVTCSRCDHSTYEEIAALGHDYEEEFTVDTEATCTTPGSKSKHCTRCEEKSEVTEIEALGHDEVSHDAKAATCTEVGWNAYVTCSRCDYTTKVEIAALGHDEVAHAAKVATCTEIGWNAYVTCSRCDHTTYEEIAALGHDYEEEFTVDTEATCTTPGSKSKHCTRCEEKSEVTEIEALGHDEVSHDAKAATCTEVGWNAHVTCSRCDYTTYEEIEALGHSFGAATYTWEGNNCTAERVCARDDSHKESETVVAVSVTTYPTCTEGGYDTLTATFTNPAFIAQVKQVNQTNAIGHDLIHHDGKAATCTEAGWNAYDTCSRCDHTTYEEIAALGHDWGEWTVTKQATIEEFGEETRVCARNGEHAETRQTAKRVAQLVGKNEENDEDEVIVSAPNGLAPDIDLVVTVIQQENFAQYATLLNTVGGEIKLAYDVKLESDGVSVQPDGTLTIRLRISEDLKDKKFKVFHLHGETATDMEYSVEGNYAVVNTDKLSEFIFVDEGSEKKPFNLLWLIPIIIGALLILGGVGFVVYKKMIKSKVRNL